MGEKTKLYSAKGFDASQVRRNITSVFEYVMNSATDSDIVAAINWYPCANAFCVQWAQVFALETWQVAGITAALSPMLRWEKNKAQALEVVARWRGGNRSLSGLIAFPANIKKAERIFIGNDPLDVLGGEKVRSFYRNIMLDNDSVTIDRHATAIALFGLDTAKSGQTTITNKLYRLLAQAYRDVALNYSVAPYVVQSVTWTYKAANGGKA